jgi:tartrate dehydratase beta subunit/fumarate hydratase class I family protein
MQYLTLDPPSSYACDATLSAPVFAFRCVVVTAAILAKNCIKKVEVLEYPELGMEAVWKIRVEDFPAFVVVDDKGNDFFSKWLPY